MSVVNEEQLLEGKAKEELAELFKKVIHFRNSHAHGDIVHDGSKICIKYFEGGPRCDELSDDYWTRITTVFSQLFDSLREFNRLIEAGKKPNSPVPKYLK